MMKIAKLVEGPGVWFGVFLLGIITMATAGPGASLAPVAFGTAGAWLLTVGNAYARRATRYGYRRP